MKMVWNEVEEGDRATSCVKPGRLTKSPQLTSYSMEDWKLYL